MQKIDTIHKLTEFLNDNSVVEEIAIQSLNLAEVEEHMLSGQFSKCLF